MEDYLEKIEFKNGLVGKIYQDMDPADPRREWDNLGTMVCFHKRYVLGDKHNYDLMDYESWWDFVAALEKEHGPCVILPLYLYDHSGITIRCYPFTCPWDSGQVGYIFVSYAKLREEYGWKRITKARAAKITEHLKGEVETYDQYLIGEVYGYVLEDADGEELHSCWGFYGDKYIKKELQEMGDNWAPVQLKLPGFEEAA